MASTILRLGLWILILSLALYVVHESFEDLPTAEYVPMALIQKGFVAGAIILIVGIVLGMLQRGAEVVIKNRCRVCRRAITKGAIYCREHLRQILHEEDEKTHMTRVRKTAPPKGL